MIPTVLRAVSVVLFAVSAACSVNEAPPTTTPKTCPDVEIVFARGTNQPPGLGRVGEPFAQAVAAGVPGRRVDTYGVDYPADAGQHIAPGVTDTIRHVTAMAARCPTTSIVLGGYSQGALVVSAVIGATTSTTPTEVLPPTLIPRIAAVVVFGNPLGARSETIETTDTPFRVQSLDYCNLGDPVCGGRGPYPGSHRGYPDDGGTARGASFVVGHLSD